MKAVKIITIARELLKVMSNLDLKTDDWRHIEMYDDYVRMRGEGEKVDYIFHVLSSRYNISESTIKRIVKRLSKEVIV